MADRGFPLKDLQQTVKSISNLSAEDRLITSKKSGASITESPLDRLRRTAKADIILEIDWTVNTVGPKSSITYNLRAIDAYSNKQVAGAEVPLFSEILIRHLNIRASNKSFDTLAERILAKTISSFDDSVKSISNLPLF